MGNATDAMLERSKQFALRGGEFDLSAETSRLALDLVGRTLLGISATRRKLSHRRRWSVS